MTSGEPEPLRALLRAGWGARKGRLTAGCLADVVVLGADPRAVPAEEIGEIPVQATLVGGELVYGAL